MVSAEEVIMIDDMKIFNPQDPSKLTNEMKKEALNLLIMVKEKKDGRMKCQAVMDGCKQRRYIKRRT